MDDSLLGLPGEPVGFNDSFHVSGDAPHYSISLHWLLAVAAGSRLIF